MRKGYGMDKRKLGWLVILTVLITMVATAALADTYTTLRYRDESEAVRQMQLALNQLGYSTGGTDGKFGPATEKAVRQFQSSNGLKVDGAAGSNTLTLLYQKISQGSTSASPSVPQASSPTTSASGKGLFGGDYSKMEYGESSSRVKLLQQALKDLGFLTGKVDGKFGAGTKQAVVAFQQANNLTADGKAGRQTLTRIESLLEGDTSPMPQQTQQPQPTVQVTQAPVTNASGYLIPTRTLRKGYQGDDVKSVQSRLKELGYYAGSLDGKYGSGSMDAVRAFQTRHGLTVDGLAGARTYSILFSSQAQSVNVTVTVPTAAPAATPTPGIASGYQIPTRVLRDGYEGDDVKSVQNRLKELGYYAGSVDGKYGSGSMAAVQAFQAQHGLEQDGLGGPKTYAVLFSAQAKSALGAMTVAPTTAPTPAPVSYATLRKGSTGDAVTALQVALANLNYSVNTNGSYTNDTVSAVRTFQQNNGLSVDGIAGAETQKKLFSGSAVEAGVSSTATLAPGAGQMTGPDKSQVQLLHWFNDVKPTLKGGQHLLVYDPATSLSWTLRIMSNGRHCDVEPLTSTDTAVMFRAFGNKNDWTPKPVYVKLPDGRWSLATTHNVPHGGQTIKNNDFNGQNCVHFLRDMSEAEKNDPKYGVNNQKVLREYWKKMTGQEIAYK